MASASGADRLVPVVCDLGGALLGSEDLTGAAPYQPIHAEHESQGEDRADQLVPVAVPDLGQPVRGQEHREQQRSADQGAAVLTVRADRVHRDHKGEAVQTAAAVSEQLEMDRRRR